MSLHLAPPIGLSINQDCDDDKGNSAEEKPRITVGLNKKVQDHADNQGETDGDGKGNGDPCNLNDGNQKKVCGVEDCASSDRKCHVSEIGVFQIRNKRQPCSADRS